MPLSVDLAALILAGGKSSRMGCDKACLEIEGRSLLRRVYDVAAQCCPSVYVVTHQPDEYKPLLPESCCWIHEGSNESDRPFEGPLVGFSRGFDSIHSDWVLLLACDLPFLDVQVLNQWIEDAVISNSPYAAWVPYRNHRWEPLCALYHQRCKESLQAFVRSGGRSFQAWLNVQPVQQLTVPTPKMLYNCNTLADLHFVTR